SDSLSPAAPVKLAHDRAATTWMGGYRGTLCSPSVSVERSHSPAAKRANASLAFGWNALLGHCSLLNNRIRSHQDRRRNREPQSLRGLQVDDQLERLRLLHGEIAWPSAFQDLVDVGGRAAKQLGEARAVGHQATGHSVLFDLKDRGQSRAGGELYDPAHEQLLYRIGRHHQRVGPLFHHGREGTV